MADSNKDQGKGAPEGTEEPQVSTLPSLPIGHHVADAALERDAATIKAEMDPLRMCKLMSMLISNWGTLHYLT